MASQNFSFMLDSFKITDTRSRHNDTDYASFTLVVKSKDGKGTPKTIKKSIGDVNNGVHKLNMLFPAVAVGSDETVVMNYLIVNSGHTDVSKIDSVLETASIKLLGLGVKGASAAAGEVSGVAGSVISTLGSIVGTVAGLAEGGLVGLVLADCDGVVAAQQTSFTYTDLMAKTAHGKFAYTTKHPGTDSAHGCGGNSMYYVDWHFEQVK